MRTRVAGAVALVVAVVAGGLALDACRADGDDAAGAELCAAMEAHLQAASDLYDAAVNPVATGADVAAAAERSRRATADLVAAAPGDLAADVAVVARVTGDLADAYEADGVGPDGVPPEVADAVRSPEYQAASGRVAAEVTERCGPG